ncbi:hypothetical protein ACFQH6_10825 [Halobacteriaceae archaeon GCM10025711]
MGSLASETRTAVRAHPFLLTALRAGVANYASAARYLDVDGDEDAVATALRRFADELPALAEEDRSASVTMQSGLGPVDDDPVLAVGDQGFAPDGGSLTGILATGDVDAAALATVLDRLGVEGIYVEAAGVAGETLAVVVGRRDGANAVRAVEDALDAVPAQRVAVSTF